MSRSSRRGRVASIFAFAYLLSARASLGQAGPDSLALSSGTAASNGTVALNLVLTSPAGSEPAAIQWTLTYPPANVVSISVSSGAALTAASKTLSCSASSGAYICVAWGMNAGIISNGTVAVVNLIMAAGLTTTPIAIGNNVASSPAGIAIPLSATGGTVTATQYQLTTSASPAAGGTVTPAGGLYNAGTVVNLTATANSGYQFSTWSGSVAAANSATTTVTMSAAETVTANFVSSTGITGITLQTNPAGLQFTVDGGAAQTAPQTLNLTQGTQTIAVATTQAGAAGTQYVFGTWSDGGAASHTIMVTSSAATYTASFTTQYQLTMAMSPTGSGTVTPASGGFYAAGTPVAISATPGSGYAFENWTGSGVASASSASTTVTLSAPTTLTANFQLSTAVLVSSMACNPTSLGPSSSSTCTVTLNNPTVGLSVVSIASNNTNLTAPSGLVITKGTTGSFTATAASTITSNQTATLAATLNGATANTSIGLAPTQYQLTTSASPAAGGTVTPATGGFYNAGTVVNLTATAASGYQFSSWSGPVAAANSAATTVTMSAAETVTANFVSFTGITIQTNPAGLQFTVDGGAVQTAPQTLSLTQGSHTIAVATTQAGAAGTQYVFSAWSDGGAASHSITVTSSAATYTASFTTQYQLTTSASPAAGGTVTPATGGFYNTGTVVNLTATAASGYQFSSWSGSVAAANSAATTVTMSAAETVTANFVSSTGITIQTNPAGRQFTVDGGAVQTAPQTLNLTQGSHTIAVATTQAGAAGTQYVFSTWSDGGAASHTITVTSSAATYTASFTTQYQLTISASPVAGGTVTPATGGFYNAGTVVNLTATANSGYQFGSWSGSVAATNSAATTVTMSAAETVTANFVSLTGITIQTNPAGRQFTVDGGAVQTAPQTLNLTQGTHTIAVPATQAGAVGTQYVFTGWSDGGAASHSIVVASSGATYTATFAVQYLLTTAVSPAGAGSVMASPFSDGYYNQGTSVQLTASASAGFQFISWGGELSGSANPQSIIMNAAYSVTVNFSAPSCSIGFTPAAAAGLPATATSTVVACPTNFGGQIGVFRPPVPVGGALGFFTLNESGSYVFTGPPSDLTTQFGLAGDYPVAGDWDGTGIIRIGVFRCPAPGTGVCSWYLDQNNNGVWDGTFGDITFQFGLPGDIPVVGDWDGTGVSKVGVMRCPAVGQPGLCTWILDVQNVRSPNSSTFLVDSYGLAGDQPAVGNWAGLGGSHPVDQIGVFRSGLWILNSSGSGSWIPSDTQYSYGLPGDVPVTGDWQGASNKRIGVFRCPAGAPGSAVCQWILNTNGSGAFSPTDLIASYGLAGDKPVVGFWTIP